MGGNAGLFPVLLAELSTSKKSATHTHAAHFKASQMQRLETFTDNQLCASSANIHHQPFTLLGHQRMGNPEIDQASLLLSPDN
jgi:hypothetical protein